MSATDKHDAHFEVGVAHVNFRARCETLGHGDEVFLVSEEGHGPKKVCLLPNQGRKIDLNWAEPDECRRIPRVLFGDTVRLTDNSTRHEL
jgi:hypothetical protein